MFRKLYDLRIRPINLLAFFICWTIWLENFNFESIITPRSFSLPINFNSCIWSISIFTMIQGLVFDCPKRNTLHFETLNHNCHFSGHDTKRFKSFCNSLCDITDNNISINLVSSAKINNLAIMSVGKSYKQDWPKYSSLGYTTNDLLW